MEIREQTEIGAPLEVTWPLLQDVNLIAECLPGASLDGEVDEENRHQGTLTVQFGPTRVSFMGSVLFQVFPDEHRVEVDGRGRDGRGRNRASVALMVLASDIGNERTGLQIDGDIEIAGPLESFAATGGRHLAQELLRTFTENMASRLAATGPATVSGSSHPAGGDALSFGSLVWRAIREWFRGLGRRSRD